jgi:3D (Asp-Asp-Asp) domain-containing protein
MKKFYTILIAILLILSYVLVYQTGKEKTLDWAIEEQTKIEEKHINSLQEFTKNYNELYTEFNELYKKYIELKDLSSGWETYKITAYTSLDNGCDSISATGINIEDLSRHFNFCAVDPEIIPYGSVVLIKFDTGIFPFLAVDCGGAINGKHIDLYFVNDLDGAFQFGNREMEVKIIK